MWRRCEARLPWSKGLRPRKLQDGHSTALGSAFTGEIRVERTLRTGIVTIKMS